MLLLLGMSTVFFPQSQFRSGRFFHHSTGNRIWGPNGSSTSIPNEMTLYNTEKGYIGNNEVSMNETWFPSDDNEWYTWHRIFDNSDPNDNIYPYLENNKIIVIKSCYPSSEMIGAGGPSDTLNNPSLKTIYNYKWHWRSIIQIMKQHPDNFFVIWTNAPLVPSATNSQQASLADQFCTWAKDTLATGNDPLLGEFPSNVYVFDFFHKLADATGMLQLQYATSTTDSHPNGLATELVSPQFVQEIFNAAIFYEDHPLPVELSSFSASTIGSTVKLSWRTETEVNNYGFEIERKVGSGQSSVGNFEKIGFVNGNGNSNSPEDYTFEDKMVESGKYSYRLKQIDNDGQFEYSKTIEIYFDVSKKFELSQNYPNPFNPSTTIKFNLSESGNAKLTIYNLLGQEIQTIANNFKEAGTYEETINITSFSSGIYWYKLEINGLSQSKKMVLMR